MAFTLEQESYILNIVSNALFEDYSCYVAHTLDNLNYDLVIYLFDVSVNTTDIYHYTSDHSQVIYVNTKKEESRVLEVKEEININLELKANCDIATNLYSYMYNPVAYTSYLYKEMNPQFDISVPEAKVEINNTTDIETALQHYVPSEFLTVMPIMLGLVVMYLFVFRLFRKNK